MMPCMMPSAYRTKKQKMERRSLMEEEIQLMLDNDYIIEPFEVDDMNWSAENDNVMKRQSLYSCLAASIRMKCLFVGILAICLLAIIPITILARNAPKHYVLVKTECGYVEGKEVHVVTDNGRRRTVHEFLNIPYAASPTGDLRWRAPVRLKQHGSCWNGTLKYNEENIMCIQTSADNASQILGQEDCLILNIWSPATSKKKKLPVLVYIHGGGMLKGSGRKIGHHPDGEFSASMEVISVSINYRLNIFGFLSLRELWINNTSGGYGNYAIMDQILALQWIKENIGNFGGDANDVTIFGHSGGGTAAYCLLSASIGLAKGLFHKVIVSSGAPNVHTTHIEANELYRPFIRNMGCIRNSSYETASCLRSHDAKTVVQRNQIMMGNDAMDLRDYTWVFPKNENRNLSGFPLQIIDPLVVRHSPSRLLTVLRLLSTRNKLKLDLLLGNMAQEPNSTFAPNITWSFNELKQYIEPKVNSFKKGLYDELLELYKIRSRDKHIPPADAPYYVYSVMTSDILLSCATTQLAYDLSSYDSFNVYSYIESQPVSTVEGKVLTAEHRVDTLALFGFGLISGVPSPESLKLMKNLRAMFKSFIYSGNGIERKYRNKTMEFWNSTVSILSRHYHEKECKLFRENGFLKHSWGNVGRWN